MTQPAQPGRSQPAKSHWYQGLLESPLDWCLAAVPAGIAVRFVPGWKNETLLFVVAGIAIIPLAGWMGRATDHLARRLGSTVGGLLNASFGNAAELIIALMALSRGLTGVVKASISGSIIGNILLVAGGSILAGGLRHRCLSFNRVAAGMSANSLSLAAIALVIPTVFHATSSVRPEGWDLNAERHLSLVIAGILGVTYLLSLVFSLGTHRGLLQPSKDGGGEQDGDTGDADAAWPVWKSIVLLVVATALVAMMSEFLVDSIEVARKQMGLTEAFVGVVVVAIVGNAAEHYTAIQAALKNKMDLSLGVTIGSSIQVALFVTPVLVFASYAFPHPLSLEFTVPEIAAVALAVWVVGTDQQ